MAENINLFFVQKTKFVLYLYCTLIIWITIGKG